MKRRCECGVEVVAPALGTSPLVRTPCPGCGRAHLFSYFEKMDVALSEACNQSCQMCRRPPEPRFLPKADVIEVIEQAAAIGMSCVSFCGGEPFVHRDFMAIADAAIATGMKVQLVTNGSLVTQDKAEALRGLDCMTISVDGRAEVHDRIRGTKGSYERCVRALNFAADAGITTGTNTVIQRDNAGELLDAFLELLDRTNGRLDYVRHAPVEVTADTAHFLITQEQLPSVQEQLQAIADECERRDIFFCHRKQLLEHLALYVDKWTRHRPVGGCRIPRKFIGYSYLGFYLCWHQGHSIRAKTLLEALESDVAREVISTAAAGECVGCNALTYSWDEEWNDGILRGKLVDDSLLPRPETTTHGTWVREPE